MEIRAKGQTARGFTILEVIVALLIFMGAGGGIAAAHLYCHRLSEDATDSMRAVNDLDDMMERIQATPFPNLQAAFPNGVPNGGAGDPYAAIVGGFTLDGEQITVTYPSQTAVRLEMMVAVNWLHRGRVRTSSTAVVRTGG